MKNDNNNTEIHPGFPAALDGPIAAPEHHRVVFENEQVRVMEFRVPAGDIVPAHTHRWPSINYVFSLSDFLSYDADGRVKFDSRTERFGAKEGEAFCLPAFPPVHSVKNIGGTEMRGISIELKDGLAEAVS